MSLLLFFFFKQKTAYEMRISDWSSDVCSSDLEEEPQRADDAVHRWCGDARLLLLDLELPDILGARGVGRAPEPGREPSDIATIITMRLLREAAPGHVVDKALAQRADLANMDKLVHRSTTQVQETNGYACGSPRYIRCGHRRVALPRG